MPDKQTCHFLVVFVDGVRYDENATRHTNARFGFVSGQRNEARCRTPIARDDDLLLTTLLDRLDKTRQRRFGLQHIDDDHESLRPDRVSLVWLTHDVNLSGSAWTAYLPERPLPSRYRLPMVCPFCTLPAERIRHRHGTAIALRDAYPISPGHTLIVPTRHVGSFFETREQERLDLLTLLDEARAQLLAEHSPDSFNIGINDGPAAGQTVPHLHIHLIPRYQGDQADPRGGVRWIFADKADYWSVRQG